MKDADLTLVRSDGTVIYAGKDIAYAMWKHDLIEEDFKYKKFIAQPNEKILWSTEERGERNHPDFKSVDTSINVIDVRQSYYQDSVKAALKLISGREVEYVHYDYDLVSLSPKTAKQIGVDVGEKSFIHMSGRKGWFVNTDNVLDVLFKKAFEETKKRHPDASYDLLRETAEKIAVGALRYELEKISPEKIIVFDMDDALKLEGNAAPYLQYTYTRASSILKKTETVKKFDANCLKDEKEIKLLKLLAKYPFILEKSSSDLQPHYISNYVYELSESFNLFYQFLPVLKAEGELRDARLKLVESVRNVLKSGLNLLGIPVMEKM
jgi:arginyl-tRNA synthetase